MSNTEPIQPVEEPYVGYNIPYRGIVDHGVKSDNKFQDEIPELDYETIADPVQPLEQLEPLPVKLVNDNPRVRRMSRMFSYTLDNVTPIMILGEQESRTRALVFSNGEIVIANDPSQLPNNGFTQPNNQQALELLSMNAVYAIAKTTATVSIYMEYDVEIPSWEN